MVVQEAQSFLQAISKEIQDRVHRRIASLVTRCLEEVYKEEGYEFHILFERKRGKTEPRLVFTQHGMELDVTEVAGGVVDVAAFGLKVACLCLQRPKPRLYFQADEPFRNVNGEEYQSRVGAMILQLSKDLDLQFLIVSDDDWMEIGKVVRL